MTNNDIRLLCLDIDGTLLDSAHKLPPENRAAVCWAEGNGVTVCLMSARPYMAVTPIWEQLGITGPTACFGGALVLCGNKHLYDCRIPDSAAMRVVRETTNRHLHLSVYRDNGWYVSSEDKWSAQESAITGLSPVSVQYLGDMIPCWGAQGAHKLLCMGESYQITRLGQAVAKKKLPLKLIRSKDEYLEIVAEGVSKAAAMEQLCRHLGIPPECTMAIGDHDNDCDMLRSAGIGVAMGNASDSAKQAAGLITLDNDHAGVAYAIRKWLQKDDTK